MFTCQYADNGIFTHYSYHWVSNSYGSYLQTIFYNTKKSNWMFRSRDYSCKPDHRDILLCSTLAWDMSKRFVFIGCNDRTYCRTRFCFVVIAMLITAFDSFILMVSSSDYRTHVLLFLRNKPRRKTWMTSSPETLNGSQLAKLKKRIPLMLLPWNL